MTKRFFDMEAPVATGGGEMVSAASALATSGKRIEAGEYSEEIEPMQQAAQKVEVKQEGAMPEATTTVEHPAAEAKSEPVKTEQEAAVIPQKAEATAPVVQDWREVLKKEQPDTVFKELGVDGDKLSLVKMIKEADPKMVSFLTKWQNGEDLTEHLRVMTTDYGKMPAEEVMRNQLRQEYPKASDAALEVLFEDEVLDKYKIDPEKYTEAEIARGTLLLEAKADRYREDLIKQQQDYLFSKAPEKQAAPEITAQQLEREQVFTGIKNDIQNSSIVKDISTSNQFSFGEGEEKFNFPIAAEEIVDMMINGDGGKYTIGIEKDANGQDKYIPNTENALLSSMVLKYGKDFLTEFANHFKTVGAKKAVAPIDNAKPTDTTRNFQQGTIADTTTASAMATQGRRVTSGD